MNRIAIETIQFSQLSLELPSGAKIFKGIDFDFPTNSIVWLKGETGTGKSLLAKLLGGMIMPTAGEYSVNGNAVNKMTFEEFLPYRLNIGYSFDFGGLINNRTIYGNLALPLEYHNALSPVEMHTRITEYLHVFNLQNVANERPSSVAGGLRKATCLARAFILEPQLLLLDDPTTGLRGDTASKLSKMLLEKRAKGKFQHIFIATEDAKFMQSLNPLIVEIKNKGLHVNEERAAA